MNTTQRNPQNITHGWQIIDLETITLGRAATQIATFLIGKHKPDYTPHVDGGDYVVVLNAGKIKVTGQKWTDKMYRHHSGIPGGFREYTMQEVHNKDPKKIVIHAVTGMLPKNKLRAPRLKRLKIYNDATHPYAHELNLKQVENTDEEKKE